MKTYIPYDSIFTYGFDFVLLKESPFTTLFSRLAIPFLFGDRFEDDRTIGLGDDKLDLTEPCNEGFFEDNIIGTHQHLCVVIYLLDLHSVQTLCNKRWQFSVNKTR